MKNEIMREKAWEKHNNAQFRKKILERLNNFNDEIMKIFNSIQPPTSIQLLPLWHGTSLNDAKEISRIGLLPLQKTDEGFFGKGIYLTNSAEYAGRIYGTTLILCWTRIANPYPVIQTDMVSILIKPFSSFFNK